MEAIDKIIQEEVGRMSRQTSASTSKPLLSISPVVAFSRLLAAYKDVVRQSGRTFTADIHTLENIKKVAVQVTQPSEKRGIYLGGNCGNGKTTMMRAFVRMCTDLGITPLMTSAPKMVAWHLNDHSVLDLPHQEKIICLDDLGTESADVMVYGNKISVMSDFFEEAYKTRCFLFVTSNLGAKEIEERYGERVKDRFREIFTAIKFSNPSFR